MKKILIPLLCASLLFTAMSGCVEETPEEEMKNIVETAIENGNFETLVAAVTAADLVDTLSDENSEFTVFAPTDEAFAALDSAILTNLVENDTTNLTKILTYHVLGSAVMSTDITDGMRVETVQGKYIEITVVGDNVYIDNAMVTTADIECSNGVIHVIDAVMMPKDNIVETAIAEGFDTLVTAVLAADLQGTLGDESAQFTVFAPTDAAFAKLNSTYLTNLVENDTANLTTILTYHVLASAVYSTDLSNNMTATTVEGTDIVITIVNETVYLNDIAMVAIADIECSNGVIHVIDTVITP